MLKKIARVVSIAIAITALPGVIAACGGGDGAAPSTGKSSDPIEPGTAKACTNVGEHDDAKCKGGYSLLDEINDESCEALNDAAETAKEGALTLKLGSFTKGSPGTFSWGKASAKRSPLKRVLDVLEPEAAAHGRTDGDVYMLVLENKNCEEVVRVFTKKTSWAADAAAWSKLTGAAGPLTATVVLATLDNSAVKDGTEAKASKGQTFSIK